MNIFYPSESFAKGLRRVDRSRNLTLWLFICLLFPFSLIRAQYHMENFGIVNGYANGKLTGTSVQSNVAIGQKITALSLNTPFNSITAGMWGFYLLSPRTPIVLASQGDYSDRVELSWTFDILSPPSDNDYFQIYRDGSLLANVPAIQTYYKDFSVLPGNYYEYKVIGVNEFGQSPAGVSVGFINPNGTFTGRISTQYGTPVNDVEITVLPNLGKSFKFDGFSNYIDAGTNLSLKDTSFTIEFWLKRDATISGDVIAQNLHNAVVKDSQLVVGFKNSGNAFMVSTNGSDSISFGIQEDNNWHHYAWVFDNNKDSSYLYRDGSLQKKSFSRPYKGSGALLFGHDSSGYFNGNLDEVRIWKTILDSSSIQRNMNRTVNTTSTGLAAYWKFDEGKGTRVFDFASKKNTGIIYGTPNFADDRAPVRTSAFTDSTGFYDVEGINYGTSTNFTISPLRSGRSFQPTNRVYTLSTSNTAVNNVDFTDVSQIPVSGYITNAAGGCFNDTTVEILVDSASWTTRTFTNKDGKFLLAFEPGSTHTITPVRKGYIFNPASFQFTNLLKPIANANFSQVASFPLTVIVAGGNCEFPLGGLSKVKISSLPACYSDTASVTNTRITFGSLPPLLYKVEVTRQDQITFESQTIDLRDTSVINNSQRNLRFIYHSPLVVKFDTSMLPTKGSCGTPTIVLNQLNRYVLRYSAGEQYNSGFCPVDSITFTINNNIGDEGAPRTLFALSGGTVNDTIYAAYPNTLGGGPHPYQKQLLVKAATPDNRQAQNIFWAFVAGVKPREGQTFTSTSPALPTMILRAPPGDFSYAYWSKQKTTYTQLSMSHERDSAEGGQIYISLAPVLLNTPFSVWNSMQKQGLMLPKPGTPI